MSVFEEYYQLPEDDPSLTREELVRLIAFKVSCNREMRQQEYAEQERMAKLIEQTRNQFELILVNRSEPADVIRTLRKTLCPDDHGKLLQHVITFLSESSIPAWRKIGLLRIGLRRLAKELNIDLTELPTKRTDEEVIAHLSNVVKQHALNH
jgi:hypothetical protein